MAFNLKKIAPIVQGTSDGDFPICGNVSFAAGEAYKRLRTNILFSFADIEGCKVVGVTSSLRGEGKSTTTVNIAYTMAQADKKVLLIDADMRLSSVASKLSIAKEPGLSNVLVGQANAKDVIVSYKETDEEKEFFILNAGNEVPNPAELLGSEKMVNLLNCLKYDYDYIFIDLPPICAVADALIVSKYTDGMAVVVREEVCQTGALKETMDQLKLADANIIGFVYTGAKSGAGSYGKYKSSNYYKKDDSKKSDSSDK